MRFVVLTVVFLVFRSSGILLLVVGSVIPNVLYVAKHSPKDTLSYLRTPESSDVCVSFARNVTKFTDTRVLMSRITTVPQQNALVQARRLNMQCGIDCSTAVEFNTPIMLVLLMGHCDLSSAGGRTAKRV